MKKHRPKEIAAKLARARALAADGRTQPEICAELGGISVMTLHRWRKRYGGKPAPDTDGLRTQCALLIEENRKLRRIATDILIEIAALAERRDEALLRRITAV